MKRSEVLDAALNYRTAGLSIFPTDKDKVPVVQWGPLQQEIATQDETEESFSNNNNMLAMVGGAVSGHFEFLDVDPKRERPDIWEQYTELVNQQAPGLLDKLIMETTPNHKYNGNPHKLGYHLAYRCPEVTIPGNTQLARFIAKDGEVKTDIETRGEGGYCVVSPSPGYKLVQGSYENPPVITKEERDTLINCALELNEYIDPQKVVNGPKKPSRSNNDLSPGDDFNERGDLVALLEKNGWSFVGNRGEYQRWRRPGKDRGHSATVIGGSTFYNFSSNAHPFEPYTSYSPFAVYALLKHNGDYSAAAKALAQQGYGDKTEKKKKTTGILLNLDELDQCFDVVTDWLYRNHIPKGHPVMFAAREGDGKTSNLIQIANEVLNQRRDGVVLWVATEGRVQDTRNKLYDLGVDRKRFLILGKPGYKGRPSFIFDFRYPKEREILDQQLAAVTEETGQPVLMVIIDSIRGMTELEDSDSKAGNIMIRLNEIVCDRYRATLAYIDHFNKQLNISRLVDKVTGSTAKVAAVTIAYAILPTSDYICKIVTAKNNILGHDPPELLSVMSGNKITISEAKEDSGKVKSRKCEKWLIEQFKEVKRQFSSDVYLLGDKEGYSEHLIKKVRRELPFKQEKDDYTGRWTMNWMGD